MHTSTTLITKVLYFPTVLIFTKSVVADAPRCNVVLLSTSDIKFKNYAGFWMEIRILLDTRSERSIMTDNCRRRLNLPQLTIVKAFQTSRIPK